MFLVTILATKTTLCQQNLLSQQKALVIIKHICCVSKICRLSNNELIQQKYATHFDPTPTAYGLWPASGFCHAASARTSIVVLTTSI